MSTGRPQEHQDLRWPYVPDDVSPQDGDQGRPAPPPADEREVTPAPPPWDGGAPSQDESWKSDPGGLPGPDDDEDYEWIRYLGGGRSAQTKPPVAPARRPARPTRRKPGRDTSGSRAPGPPASAPQRSGPPASAPQRSGPPASAPQPPVPPQGYVDPGYGQGEYADPGYGLAGRADPGQERVPLGGSGRSGNADSATKRVPGGRVERGANRFGKVKEPGEAGPEPRRPEEPRLREAGRHPRRGQKAREQDQRERQQREQGRREQEAREQKARELDQRERQQREQEAREQEARDQAQRKQEAREQAQKQKQSKQEEREQAQRQRKQKQRKQKQRKPKQRKPAVSPLPRGVAKEPVTSVQRIRSSRRSHRVLSRRMIWLVAGVLLVAVSAAVVKLVTRPAAGPVHVLVTPPRLGTYARNTALAGAMNAEALRKGIVQRSSGEARNVVDAVYEGTAGSAASAGPPIILFIGGNLVGTSPDGFITSFTGKLTGAVTIGPGSLGGAAACVPSVDGRLAECAWADNDTFGVIASPNLGEAALASELRQIRPLVEHAAR